MVKVGYKMRNVIRVAAALALSAVFGLSFVAPAQAYPDPTITIHLPDDEIYGGDTFSFSVTSGSTECDWVVDYEGKQKTGSGTSISGSFGTVKVSKRTPTPLSAVCTYVTTASGNGAATADVQSAATASATATVYLLPRGGNGNGGSDSSGLPGTGGYSLWYVVGGIALVIAGGGALALSRRRSH